MSRYILKENYRDDETLRNRFYDFIATVFPSADFRTWHDHGFWFDRFMPCSLIENGRVVSNVSVTLMPLLLDGVSVPGLQIGAVGTIPERCGEGLSRRLMEHVIEKYRSSVDLMFLFANDEVVNFYPKFGFDTYPEAVFVSRSSVVRRSDCARRLDLTRADDLALLNNRLQRRQPLTRLFGATDYACVSLWHALNLFPEKIFHVESEDVIVIASEREGTLNVWDIIFDRPFDLETVLAGVVSGNPISSIHYHFAPDIVPFEYDTTEPPEDSTLFVRGAFPIAGKTFKFPFTAQT